MYRKSYKLVMAADTQTGKQVHNKNIKIYVLK